jgi:hypothetical protein
MVGGMMRARALTWLRGSALQLGVAALVASAAVAGCGSGSAGPSEAVKQFFSALRAADGTKACRLMTPQARTRTVRGATTCEQGVKELGPLLAAQLTNVKVGAAIVHGNSATVPVATPRKSSVYSLQ